MMKAIIIILIVIWAIEFNKEVFKILREKYIKHLFDKENKKDYNQDER